MKPEEEIILAKYKDKLEDHPYGLDRNADLTHIASVITSACRELKVEIPVLVGGFAVETYTQGGYSTNDLDFILNSDSQIYDVMIRLGFEKRAGYRYWCHHMFGDIVEFPTPPLDGSRDKVTAIQYDDGSECYFLGIEDLIVGRLEELVHWDQTNIETISALQLRMLLRAQDENIDFDYLYTQADMRGLRKALDLMLDQLEHE